MTHMTTSSTRPASLHAYFGYRDAPAALRWLERAFGFVTTLEFPDDSGGIMHSEMKRDDVAIMVFSDAQGYDRPARKGESIGHGCYVSIDDRATIDEIFATASSAGATVVWEPADTEWGTYRFRVLDPEGFEWTFGTLRPGESSGDWSGDDWSVSDAGAGTRLGPQ